MHGMHGIACSANTAQYTCTSVLRQGCIIVFQDVLKKLASRQHTCTCSPQESEAIATVRKVDLMSAPKCGQHTRVVTVRR